jgi:hypothetical protein
MAVVASNYIRRGKVGNDRAKDAIRYMQHRRGKDGAAITRPLFGPDGRQGRADAYRMIDEAPPGTHFYRMSLNPHPTWEDGKKDIDLREVTEKTLHALEDIVQQPVYYVAAVHAEHADHRHVYLLAAVPRRLNTPELEFLTSTTTEACLEQRRERDQSLEKQGQEREQEEYEWGL